MSNSNDILDKLVEIRQTLQNELNNFKKLGDIPKDILSTMSQIEAKLTELYKQIDMLTNQTKLSDWGVEWKMNNSYIYNLNDSNNGKLDRNYTNTDLFYSYYNNERV